MCLAIPAQVVEMRPGDQAVIDLAGVRKEISLALVEDVAVGDYVIVHVDGARVWHEVVGVDWGAGFAPYRTARTILGDTAVAPIP